MSVNYLLNPNTFNIHCKKISCKEIELDDTKPLKVFQLFEPITNLENLKIPYNDLQGDKQFMIEYINRDLITDNSGNFTFTLDGYVNTDNYQVVYVDPFYSNTTDGLNTDIDYNINNRYMIENAINITYGVASSNIPVNTLMRFIVRLSKVIPLNDISNITIT